MAKSKKYTIAVDCTDWFEEYLREEPTLACEEDIIGLVKEGVKTGKIAQMVVIARQEGHAPADIIKPNKVLLYAGARSDVDGIVARRMRELKLANGQVYEVREFVGLPGRPKDEDGDGSDISDAELTELLGEASFVSVASDEALERALRYLDLTVSGHIFGRLKQVAAHPKGDVKAVGKMIKANVDELVARLV